MKLEDLREWLIQNGIPAEELDEVSEPPVINDIGMSLMTFLINDDNLGSMMVELLMMIMDNQMRINELETNIEALKKGE